jgi:hypothetical protein
MGISCMSMFFRSLSAPDTGMDAGVIVILSRWFLQGSRLEQARVDSLRHIADN